jgi:transcription elongation factor Elf1
MDVRQECLGCGVMFESKMRIEVEKIEWSTNNSWFTVYGRSRICSSCSQLGIGKRLDMDNSEKPSMFWEKWKTIPVKTMKPSECPACGSDDIRLNSLDTSKKKGEVIIIANFFCKNCNGKKRQFIKGILNFWHRVESISIGPAEVTFS